MTPSRQHLGNGQVGGMEGFDGLTSMVV
jgi:hypothetical protein